MGADGRRGLVAVATVVAAAVGAVAAAVAFAPGPEIVDASRPDFAPPDLARPEPAVPVPEDPPGEIFAEGQLPSGHWSASVSQGPGGVCIEVELMTDRVGGGVGSCGRLVGIELAHVGPTRDGWLVVGGMADADVARVTLEGEDVPVQEVELFSFDEGSVFAVAVNRSDELFEVVAHDQDGEVIERTGLSWR